MVKNSKGFKAIEDSQAIQKKNEKDFTENLKDKLLKYKVSILVTLIHGMAYYIRKITAGHHNVTPKKFKLPWTDDKKPGEAGEYAEYKLFGGTLHLSIIGSIEMGEVLIVMLQEVKVPDSEDEIETRILPANLCHQILKGWQGVISQNILSIRADRNIFKKDVFGYPSKICTAKGCIPKLGRSREGRCVPRSKLDLFILCTLPVFKTD